jgi:two-component system alkaline phosphatase synthesis response regulator PhoP
MVWIVDDHEDTAELVAHVLTRHGIAATAFDNATGVLDALKQEKPDLLILDMMMPVMDGIELLRRIRSSARWKDIPVVIYSADYTKSRMEEAMSLGANAYLVKGAVSFEAILKTVGKFTQELN